MSDLMPSRPGIACAGNWIVDHVKLIDNWPNPGNLANILDEKRGTGGAAFNVLIDIARLRPGLPLEALGMVGDDEDGRWIQETIRPLVTASSLRIHPDDPTSYTDVMTVQSTGHRTFFHMRGANAHYDVDDVDVASIGAGIFHLGYLLLMTTLDRSDPEYGTRAARLLARCREAGLTTSIDLVSAEAGKFKEIVIPALRYTDYCIINEVEAGGVTGLSLRAPDGKPDWTAIESAARQIATLGARLLVTIHLPEGALSLDVRNKKSHRVPSLVLPAGFVKGTAGAGDAFCAGMLLGLHEGMGLEECMAMGHASAAASLRHATCTEGMETLEKVMELAASLK